MPYSDTDRTIDRAWREHGPAILAPQLPPPSLPAQVVARLRPEIAGKIAEIVRSGEALTEVDLQRLGMTPADIEATRDLIITEARRADLQAVRREVRP